jgi:hypothetical protein
MKCYRIIYLDSDSRANNSTTEINPEGETQVQESHGKSRSNISTERIQFLIESSRTSHEELMFRIKHRDDWLKIQLLAQVTMLALTFGINIGGVNATAPIPNVIALAIPTSFILTCLYVVEDNLVGYLTKERSKFAYTEARMYPHEDRMDLFEASDALNDYRKTTLHIRLLAQLVAFVLIPVGFALYRFTRIPAWNNLHFFEFLIDAALLGGTLCLIIWAFFKRRLKKAI